MDCFIWYSEKWPGRDAAFLKNNWFATDYRWLYYPADRFTYTNTDYISNIQV